MKIICLVENTTRGLLNPVHGLSIYIETRTNKILFDLGPDRTILDNAQKLNIDLSLVDTVIISHGHKDHGGGLEAFLSVNNKAKIYIQRTAFLPHYNMLRDNKDIGLDLKYLNHPQIILLDGNYDINPNLSLFITKNGNLAYSTANDSLYENDHKDSFSHEQNLVIKGKENVLIMGCGHRGVLNILAKAPKLNYSLCIGGFHLYNRKLNETVKKPILDEISNGLKKYNNIKFYTCHCTGIEAFKYLSTKLNNIYYFSSGDILELKEE